MDSRVLCTKTTLVTSSALLWIMAIKGEGVGVEAERAAPQRPAT